MPPWWCLLTIGRQTWLVASCEEEEEEGCWCFAMDLSMLEPSLRHGLETPATSWPRSPPLLACPQPRPSQQTTPTPPPDPLQHPLNRPRMGRGISGIAEGDGGTQR